MADQRVEQVLQTVAREYPSDMVEGQVRDVARIAFHIRAAIDAASPKPISELSICDIGGGIGLFSVACAAVGFRHVTLVDDFQDDVNHRVGDNVLQLHRRYGVEVCCRDILKEGMTGLRENYDVITCFDSMEHWHRSPKSMFREVLSHLASRGTFLLGVPNCVNLRKRLTVPFGRGKWSSMEDWYEQDNFRGHVREPDVSDLKYIAQDIGLNDVQIFGRNWLGCQSMQPVVRWLSKLVDPPLRAFPSLCSNIYLCGTKP